MCWQKRANRPHFNFRPVYGSPGYCFLKISTYIFWHYLFSCHAIPGVRPVGSLLNRKLRTQILKNRLCLCTQSVTESKFFSNKSNLFSRPFLFCISNNYSVTEGADSQREKAGRNWNGQICDTKSSFRIFAHTSFLLRRVQCTRHKPQSNNTKLDSGEL